MTKPTAATFRHITSKALERTKLTTLYALLERDLFRAHGRTAVRHLTLYPAEELIFQHEDTKTQRDAERPMFTRLVTRIWRRNSTEVLSFFVSSCLRVEKSLFRSPDLG